MDDLLQKGRRNFENIILDALFAFILIGSIFTTVLGFIRDWPVAARSIAGLDNATLLWEKELQIEPVSTVEVEFFLPDERSVVFQNSNILNSLDILTGEVIWETAVPDVRTIRLLDNKFYITSADSGNTLDKALSFDTTSSECSAYYGVTGLLTYNAITGEKIWGYRYDGAYTTDMFFDQESIYLKGSNDHGQSKSIVQVDKNTGSVMSTHCNRWPDKNTIPTPPADRGGVSSTYSPILEMRDIQRLHFDYYFFVEGSRLILLDRIAKDPIAFIEFSGKKLDPWKIDIVNQQNIVMIYFKDSHQLFGFRLLL